MSHSLRLSFAFLVVACFLLGPLLAAEAREVTIVAISQDSSRAASIGPIHLAEPGTAVIRSAEELVALSSQAKSAKNPEVQKAMEDELVRVLQMESIDWNKQMALVVRGEPGTKADKVRFDSLTIEDNTLTVAWKVIPRPPHAGPGTPIAVILVERFDGAVKFVPAEPK